MVLRFCRDCETLHDHERACLAGALAKVGKGHSAAALEVTVSRTQFMEDGSVKEIGPPLPAVVAPAAPAATVSYETLQARLAEVEAVKVEQRRKNREKVAAWRAKQKEGGK